jgi:hypothetical protein
MIGVTLGRRLDFVLVDELELSLWHLGEVEKAEVK